jgi:hypothetical protein
MFPTSILDLSDELLLHLLDAYLDPVSLVRIGKTCHRLSSLSKTSTLWERHIAHFDGCDETDGQGIASAQLFGALFQPRTPGWICAICNDTLLVRPSLSSSKTSSVWRCACVCRRVLLPLTVVGFSPARCGSSSLVIGFQRMLQELDNNFHLNLNLVDVLPTGEALAKVDLLLLCTTEGTELTDTEQRGLVHFVRHQGGTAIVSAFGNWSHFGHFNRRLSDWLGVRVMPGANFDFARRTTFIPGLPLGPWPSGGNFCNVGETEFTLQPEQHDDAPEGSTGEEEEDEEEEVRTSLFFPRGHERTVAGQVLVCSNFHFLADPDHWMGGLFHEPTDANRHLLLNLAAHAAAYRKSG